MHRAAKSVRGGDPPSRPPPPLPHPAPREPRARIVPAIVPAVLLGLGVVVGVIGLALRAPTDDSPSGCCSPRHCCSPLPSSFTSHADRQPPDGVRGRDVFVQSAMLFSADVALTISLTSRSSRTSLSRACKRSRSSVVESRRENRGAAGFERWAAANVSAVAEAGLAGGRGLASARRATPVLVADLRWQRRGGRSRAHDRALRTRASTGLCTPPAGPPRARRDPGSGLARAIRWHKVHARQARSASFGALAR